MIPRIAEVKEVDIDALVIGKGQARTRDVNKDIDALAESIRKVGLLEPIVVCPGEKAGQYEILTGQRRFLAHKVLHKTTILAAVIPERVDEITAKIISVTENLVRRDLNNRDVIDACTALYRRYGTIKDVAEETGLAPGRVSMYVKYEQLHQQLKSLVDSQAVSLPAALKAQQAASVTGTLNIAEAIQLAKEMTNMIGVQRDRLVKERQETPGKPVDEAIEDAKTGSRISQIIITLGAEALGSLKAYAQQEDMTQDDAASSLIIEGLTTRGLLEA